MMDQNGTGQMSTVEESPKFEKHFRQLVEQSTQGMAIADLNGDLIYVNEAWCRMHGYECSDELIGKNLAVFHTPEQMERYVIPFNEKVMELGAFSGEVGHVKANGEPFPALVTITVLKDERGNPVALAGIARDITKRKRAEAALRESEEMYRTLVETSPTSVTLCDLDGKFLYASQRTLDLYGYENEQEFLASGILDHFAQDDHQKAMENMDKTLKEGVVRDIQYNLVRKDGSKFIGELSASLVRDSNGDPMAFMATTRDITEQVQAKEALRESEARNRAILNTLPDFMFLQSLDGTFLDYHAADTSALYVSPQQFLGQKPQDIFPHDLANEIVSVIEQALSADEMRIFEYPMPVADQTRYFEARIVPYDDHRVLSVIRDITERKQIEHELSESEQQYRLLAETTHDIIALHDMEGQIRFVNQAGLDFAGYELTEMIGKSITDFIPAEYHADLAERRVQRARGDMETTRYETEFLNRVGERILVEAHSTPVLHDGQVSEILIVARDITERRQAELADQKRQRYLEGVLLAVPDAIVTLDAQNCIADWNVGAEQLFGYKSQEVIGKEIDYLIAKGESLDEAIRFTEIVSKGGEISPIETIRYHRDGSPIDVIVAGAPIVVDDELVGVVAVYTDITERKQAEKALRESEVRNRAILNAFPDLMFVQSLDGTYLDYHAPDNDALYVPPDQFLGKKPQEIFPETFAATLVELIEQAIRCDETQVYEYSLPISKRLQYYEARVVPHGDDKVLSIIRNVTEQAQAKAALAASENKFRSITENAVDCIFIKDQTRKYTFVNRAMQDLLGMSQADLLGKAPEDVFASEQALVVKEVDDRTFSGEIVNETRSLLINDRQFFFHTIQAPLSIEDGEVTSIMGIVRDVTSAKQAQLDLQRSNNRLLMALQAARMGTWDWDLQENRVVWSAETLKIFDVSEAQFGGTYEAYLNFAVPETHAEIDQLVQQFLEKPSESAVIRYEHPIVSGSGQSKWIEVRGTFLSDEQGQLTKMSGVCADITERKQAEKALMESEEKYRLLVENASEAIVVVSQDGEFLVMNNAAAGILGGKPHDFIGKTLRDIFPKEVAEKRVASVKNVIDTGQGHIIDLHIPIQGDMRWFRQSTQPIRDASGKVISALSLSVDITERKHAEKALRESEERYRALFEHANDAIFLENRNDEIIDVNRKACELMGYTRAELLQMTVADLQAPEVRGPEGRVIQEELARYGGKAFETLNIHRDGTHIPVEVSVTPISEQKDGIMLSIVRNISERKAAKEALQHYADQLETLNRITAALATSLALEDVLQLILEQIQAVVPVDSAAIFLQQERGLRVVMDWGIEPSVTGKLVIEDNKLFGQIKKNKEPLIVNDPLEDARFENWGYVTSQRAWMGVPLIVRAELIGYMTLDSSQPGVYTPDLIPLVKSFAAQAAQAIDNARQFSTAQRRLDRLTSLHRIDQAISSSLDLRITLNILLEQVLAQLQVDAAAILLYQPEIQSLEFVAGQGFRTQALRFTNLRLGEGFAGVAALERRIVHISDLDQIETGFLRAQEFRHEKFVNYIGVPLIAKGNITGVLEIYHRQPLNPDTEWMSFLDTLAGQAAIAIDNINLFSDLQRSNLELIQAYDATIEGWARALELRDIETEGHSRRVVDLTLELCRKLGVDEKQLAHVRRGALLHDIGKMGIPDDILQKSSKLTDEEWEIMKNHPVYAYQMLSSIPYLKSALDIPYYHHEKWDGTGYPRGLVGEQIPLAARIFAVVDVWDALSSDRPYRKAWPQEKVMSYIQKQSGKRFDPQVVSAFVDLLSQDEHLANLMY